MGHPDNRKITILILLLLVVCVAVYGKPEPARSVKEKSLNEILAQVDGWKAGAHIPYDQEIVDGLALDDYVNKVFVKGDSQISLYIGYYLTRTKVGAAHDPLVCFPGQGWKVSDRKKGEVLVGENEDLKVAYSTMKVELGADYSNIILYWFQAYGTASADTFSQKISTMFNTIEGLGQDNAFVRLTCNISNRSEAECLEILQDFTKAFYPVFLGYITE